LFLLSAAAKKIVFFFQIKVFNDLEQLDVYALCDYDYHVNLFGETSTSGTNFHTQFLFECVG